VTDPRLKRMGFVVIGRNEGSRLRACLASIRDRTEFFVYVDSGSTDGSPCIAREVGAEVVELDSRIPFSAARARNAGFERLCECYGDLQYVHFVDGDCVLVADWPAEAIGVLEGDAGIVAVCGCRRESFPDASVFNRICDVEWRIPPIGEAEVFGGEVVIRVDSFAQVSGYDADVIACEDEELALRLRAIGGRILRLDVTSSHHDAAIFSLNAWFLRAVRWGHGVAQVGSMHAGSLEYYYAKTRRRTWVYGGAIPMAVIGFALPTHGLSFVLLLLYVLQFCRSVNVTQSKGIVDESLLWSLSCVTAQPANFAGMLLYYYRSWLGTGLQIIEYKRGKSGRKLGRIVSPGSEL
jgi:glycosyltransferase involved in cell wall biosynthesis